MDQKRAWGRPPGVASSLLVGVVLLSACAGENLFSIAAAASASGPTVGITAPGEGFTIAVGDSILVLADVTSPDGATLAVYRASYTDTGDPAYTGETETLGSVPAANLTNYLLAVDGQVPGQVYVVVEITDALGQMGADSVQVTIAN